MASDQLTDQIKRGAPEPDDAMNIFLFIVSVVMPDGFGEVSGEVSGMRIAGI
jgi:hypothetical protein